MEALSVAQEEAEELMYSTYKIGETANSASDEDKAINDRFKDDKTETML